jgi:cell division protease FtsH
MVMEWGYSEELGFVNYNGKNEYGMAESFSGDSLKKIETEVRRFIDEGYKEAKRILTENRDGLEAVAQGLLEYETLTGQEIKDLLDGKPPSRDDFDTPEAPRSSAVPKAGKSKPKSGDGDMAPEPQA